MNYVATAMMLLLSPAAAASNGKLPPGLMLGPLMKTFYKNLQEFTVTEGSSGRRLTDARYPDVIWEQIDEKDPETDLATDLPVGTGGFADVYRYTDAEGRSIAVKKIIRNAGSVQSMDSMGLVFLFNKNIEFHDKYNRPFQPFWETFRFIQPRGYAKYTEAGDARLWLLMSYGEKSLDTWRRELGKPRSIPVSAVLEWARQLLQGLHKLHLAGLVHGDIKLDNMLLDEQKEACFCDYGTVMPAFKASMKPLDLRRFGQAMYELIHADGGPTPENIDKHMKRLRKDQESDESQSEKILLMLISKWRRVFEENMVRKAKGQKNLCAGESAGLIDFLGTLSEKELDQRVEEYRQSIEASM